MQPDRSWAWGPFQPRLFCDYPCIQWFAASCTSKVRVPCTTAVLSLQLLHCPRSPRGSAAAWLHSALPGPLNSCHWNRADRMGASDMRSQAERHGVQGFFFFLWYQSKWVWKLEKGINYSWFQMCWLGSFLVPDQHLIPGFSFPFSPLPIPTATLLVPSSQDVYEKSYN